MTLSVSGRGLQQSGQLLISVCSGHVLSVLLSNFERIIFSLKGKIRIIGYILSILCSSNIGNYYVDIVDCINCCNSKLY